MSIAISDGTGSIIVTYTNTKTSTAIRSDSYCKGQFNIVADKNRNVIVFNSIGTAGSEKGNPSQRFRYEEITSPSSTDVLDLKSQIDAWNVASGGSVSGVVTNEDAKSAEMTGSNDVFTTTYPFVYHSIEVFFNELKMTLNVDYTEDGAAGEITFLTITPDATLPTPDTLTFNYIKL